ncbi:glucose-6-phosphate dehydrogenase assembly protein OpcA [Gordonia jinhuaensis]|uniref:OxpP cycle protein OpcA n=1 Tax=Gordonia jinhuaensis TaxID=1517702 RepID=A0A916WRY1_9ACTN|nr:glucose-6-phosphate dehydrogenase assembly protein OpcA [Gordonia jinhuaensis]GGB24901.1 putative OxpP cycle protein OpcA [Gordonia jinhuaensis]
MIVDMQDTSTSEVAKKIVQVRESGGAVSLGRVLTLVVAVEHGEPTEGAIEAAVAASREHPSRIIVLSSRSATSETRLDAEIRVGGDAGASEVVVLYMHGALAEHPHSVVIPFLLPDTPVVTWWPGAAPEHPSRDPLGKLGRRRILDAGKDGDPQTVLARRLATYAPGDSDLSWTQITYWRAILASAMDRPPHSPVTSVQVAGPNDSPSLDLLAGWLRSQLGVPTSRVFGSFEVRLDRDEGPTVLAVDQNNNAVLTMPGKPDGRIAMTRRDLPVCIAEELRHLDADEVYLQSLQGAAEVDYVDDLVPA